MSDRAPVPASFATADAVRTIRGATRRPWPLLIAAAALWFTFFASLVGARPGGVVLGVVGAWLLAILLMQRWCWRADVRQFRRGAGRCAMCFYDRAGLKPDQHCPECGTPPAPAAAPECLAVARRCPPLLGASDTETLQAAIERTAERTRAWSPWPVWATRVGVAAFIAFAVSKFFMPDRVSDQMLRGVLAVAYTAWVTRVLLARGACLAFASAAVRRFTRDENEPG